MRKTGFFCRAGCGKRRGKNPYKAFGFFFNPLKFVLLSDDAEPVTPPPSGMIHAAAPDGTPRGGLVPKI
jgi:hypothetical protein